MELHDSSFGRQLENYQEWTKLLFFSILFLIQVVKQFISVWFSKAILMQIACMEYAEESFVLLDFFFFWLEMFLIHSYIVPQTVCFSHRREFVLIKPAWQSLFYSLVQFFSSHWYFLVCRPIKCWVKVATKKLQIFIRNAVSSSYRGRITFTYRRLKQ